MGYTWVKCVIDHSLASRTEYAVLLMLAERANEWGGCWPSVADIAKRARCSRRMAQINLRKLKARNEVYYEEPIVGGLKKTTVYVIVGGRPTDEVAVAYRATCNARRKYSAAGATRLSSARGGATQDADTAQSSPLNRANPALPRAQPTSPEPRINPAAEQEENTQNQNVPFSEDAVRAFLEEHYRRNPRHRNAPEHAVQRLLSDVGCDQNFALEAAARRITPERAVRSILKARSLRLRNPGGWLRRELGL